MNCRICGKFNWEKDSSRKHGRKGRYFVRCGTPGCVGRAQCSSSTGKVFQTSIESGLVGRYFDITKEQDKMLGDTRNKSETVRIALDNYFKTVYTTPYNT